jgi:glutathione S-transferase
MNSDPKRRRLWGIGTPRTLRPHWMLAELGLEYETIEIITRTKSMDSAEFAALSKRKKVPLFEDGDLMIGESAAIILYLADRYRDLGSFAPEPDTNDRARHDELCFFIMSEMDAALYIIRRHGGLPEIYGASTTAVESAKAYFLRSSEEVGDRMRDGRAYLLGDRFSCADLLLKTCLDWAGFVSIELTEPLSAYSARIAERPAYGVAMAKNFTQASLAALLGAGEP